MRPDVIISDELSGKDVEGLERLVRSGIQVIASIHAQRWENLPKKCSQYFDVVVFLQSGKLGIIREIYQKTNEEWTCVFTGEGG